MTKKKIDKKVLDEAKKRFMKYQSMTSISKSLKIPKSTLHYHIDKYWKPERELAKAELFQKLTESKRVDFTKITEASIQIMARSLGELATRPEPPTMQEATKAAEIMEKLDKIMRLDDGNPTDIVSNQEKPMTIETIRQKISLDPFEEVPVVGYEEKNDEDDSEETFED